MIAACEMGKHVARRSRPAGFSVAAHHSEQYNHGMWRSCLVRVGLVETLHK